jgi:hypothetical protein
MAHIPFLVNYLHSDDHRNFEPHETGQPILITLDSMICPWHLSYFGMQVHASAQIAKQQSHLNRDPNDSFLQWHSQWCVVQKLKSRAHINN